MIYEILVIILPFITSPYIARVIGAEGLGVYSFTYTVAGYFVLFAMLGIKNYGNRTIAIVRDNPEQLDSTFSSLFMVHLIFALICCVVYFVYAWFIAENRLYAMIQMVYVCSAIFDISWLYFGIEKFKITVTRSSIIKILNVIFVFMFVKEQTDLWKYCLIMAGGMFLNQITLWIPLKKYVSFVKPDIKSINVHIKPLFILFIPIVAISLYKFMDKIMIGLMSSKSQLGFYENAEKVCNIPVTVISSFGTVMLPKMSNLAAKSDKKDSGRYTMLSFRYIMLLAIAFTFGMAGVGDVFSVVFWGNEFEVSGSLIMALAVTIPFLSFANILRTQYLIPNRKDIEYTVSVIIGAVINFIINTLLIKKMGAMGAGIGTICAEASVCLCQAFTVRKVLPLREYIKQFIVYIPFGVIMYAVVYMAGAFMNNSIVTLIVQIICGVAIYCIFVLVYFIKTKDKLLYSVLDKFKGRKNR